MSYRQLELNKENSQNICQPIAGLLMLPDEFARRFGISFIDDDYKDGLGPVKAALIETASHRRFGLVHYVLHPEPRGISVWTQEHSPDPATDLQDFMVAFGLTRADFLGVYGESQPE